MSARIATAVRLLRPAASSFRHVVPAGTIRPASLSANPCRRSLSTSCRLSSEQKTPHDASSSSSSRPDSKTTNRRMKRCPKCSTALPLAVSPCPQCRTLVPIPSELDCFTVFELGSSSGEEASSSSSSSSDAGVTQHLKSLPGGGFDIDVRDLRSKFLKRQQSVHPDSFSAAEDVSILGTRYRTG